MIHEVLNELEHVRDELAQVKLMLARALPVVATVSVAQTQPTPTKRSRVTKRALLR